MQFLLFVGLLVSFLLGCTSVPSNSSIRNLPVEDQEIRAGNGTFVLRDVNLDGAMLPGSWIVKGIVRNNTGQDWKRIQFYFTLFDTAGLALERQIDSDITFIADSLNAGDIQPFTTNYFKTLLAPGSLQWVGKYIVTYQGTATESSVCSVR